jgi:membrane protein
MTGPYRERQLAASSFSHGERRGRDATGVSEIPASGWKDILRRVYDEVGEDHVLLIAAGVTFYALLALVPALTAIVSIYGLFADPVMLNQHVARLQGIVPEGGLSVLREQLERLAAQGETRLGLTSAVSLAIALWSANSGMKALIEAMNVAYDEQEKRGFVRLTLVSLAFTLATIAALLLMLGLVVVLPVVMEILGFVPGAQLAVRVGGFLLFVAAMIAGLAALYRYGPSRERAKWRWITPGATLAIVVTLIVSGLFSWYVANFGSYNATYGSLGALFGFMTWLWIAATILIVGAELNAETEHQTRRDSTTGPPRPMGSRGAMMADTVGESRGSSDEEAGATARPAGERRGPRALGIGALAALLWLERRRRRGS